MSMGSHLLATYLDSSGRSCVEFAEAVGAHRSQIYRCAAGERGPGRKLATRIETETGGAVPASSWDQPVKPKSRRSAANHPA